MKKQKAFTLAEMLVVIIIIGLVVMLSVPLMISDARHKIQNTQFFEAYRAVYEGAKRAKLNSPTGKLDLYRAGRFGISTCDLFAQIFSLTEDGSPQASTASCIEGIDPDTGLCNDCVESDTECPLDRNFKRTKYEDGHCTIKLTSTKATSWYCQTVPSYIVTYGDSCNDKIDRAARPYTFKTDLGNVEIEEDITTSCGARTLGYNTNFDDPALTPNFTTSNGLTFYGLNEYPAGICLGNNYQNILLAERLTAISFMYRDVYVDTNGKSSSPHRTCEECNIAGFAYNGSFISKSGTGVNVDLADQEAQVCETQLECLKTNFGVYKFRIYSNGRVEPITNRKSEEARLKYKLLYVANNSIVEVPNLFQSYQAAREYTITDDTNFYYWHKNFLTAPKNQLGWRQNSAGDYDRPCIYDTDTLECAIIPIIPEVRALPIKTRK